MGNWMNLEICDWGQPPQFGIPLSIFKVVPDSLADHLGIKAMDSVLAVDGARTDTLIDVKRALLKKLGQRVDIRVLREGKEQKLRPTVPSSLDKYRQPPK